MGRVKSPMYCEDRAAPIEKDCPGCVDALYDYAKLAKRCCDDADKRLATAVRWLRRLEREHPGCLNPGAIEKHLVGGREDMK